MLVTRGLAVLVLIHGAAAPVAALPGLFDLGVLPVPGQLYFESEAYGVSADGRVVVGIGKSHHPEEAYPRDQAIRFEDGVLQGLAVLVPRHDSSIALGASGDGEIVVGTVYAETDGTTDGAFAWDGSGNLALLPDLPGGPVLWSGARGVSSDGSVVVGSSPDALDTHAVRWDLGVLFALASGPFWSYAHAVDGDGSTVVGMHEPWIPMRWDGAAAQALPLPIGMLEGSAEGISSDGTTIVGWSRLGAGAEVATRWDGAGAALLGTLPGDFRSRALDASGDGSLVVGWSEHAVQGRRAVVWDALSGLRDLRDVLEDDYGFDLTGWVLREARGISDDGTVIVGMGKSPQLLARGWLANLGGNGAPACSNGSDDDGDGAVDGADPGCASALDVSELSHLAQCDDGLDNDADGDVDFPGDPGCTGLAASPEGSVCDDDLDNDLDGRIDWDGGSGGAPPDPRCAGNPLGTKEKEAPVCGLGFEAALAVAAWARLRRRRALRR